MRKAAKLVESQNYSDRMRGNTQTRNQMGMKDFQKKGGVKRPLRTKEVINKEGTPDDRYYEKGFKVTRTNPFTNKTVEKSKVTSGYVNYEDGYNSGITSKTPKKETTKKIITDRKGNVKEKTKTFNIGYKVSEPKPDNLKIATKYEADKKIKTVTKNGEGFQKTNEYLDRIPKIKLAEDKLRSSSGKEKVKISTNDLKKQQKGGISSKGKSFFNPGMSKSTKKK
jgi:hypothetical protein